MENPFDHAKPTKTKSSYMDDIYIYRYITIYIYTHIITSLSPLFTSINIIVITYNSIIIIMMIIISSIIFFIIIILTITITTTTTIIIIIITITITLCTITTLVIAIKIYTQNKYRITKISMTFPDNTHGSSIPSFLFQELQGVGHGGWKHGWRHRRRVPGAAGTGPTWRKIRGKKWRFCSWYPWEIVGYYHYHMLLL